MERTLFRPVWRRANWSKKKTVDTGTNCRRKRLMRMFASTPRLTGPGCGALASTHKNLLIHVRRFLSWSRNVSRGEVRLSI
jgi:hypothetical protein